MIRRDRDIRVKRAVDISSLALGPTIEAGRERALAFIKNSAHPATGRCHRFRERLLLCRHEDVAGDTRAVGRISEAGRFSGSRGGRYVHVRQSRSRRHSGGRAWASALLKTVIFSLSVVMMCTGQGTVPVWRPGTALPI
jgi:hypothetical protein